MAQNNFEDELRKKLNELKLIPPEKVWTEVEKHIRKKDRKKYLIFLMSLLTILILSGVYLYVRTESGRNSSIAKSMQISKSGIASSKENLKQDDGSGSNKNTVSGISKMKKSPLHKPINIIASERSYTKKKTVDQLPKQKFKDHLLNRDKKNSESRASVIPMKKSEYSFSNEAKLSTQKNNIITNSDSDNLSHKEISRTDITHNKEQKKIEDSTNLFKEQSSENVSKTKKKENHRWSLGINLSTGISAFSSTSSTDKSLQGSLSGNVTNPNPGGTINYPPSKLRSSTGFSAGISTKKKLTNRISFSTGLNYKYYSLTNKVGQRITPGSIQLDYLSNRDPYFNATISQPQEYKNQFHFIELPVSISFQLNKGNKLPVNFELGIHLMRLISTNALQYLDSSSVYYKDNSLFQKTQSGMHTGLYFTLFASSKLPVNLGPFFEYNFTPLAGKGLYQNKKLNYFGLSAEIFLKKNN